AGLWSASLLGFNGSAASSSVGNTTPRTSSASYSSLASLSSSGDFEIGSSQWEYQRAEPTDIYGGGVKAPVHGPLVYPTPTAELRLAEGKKRPMTDPFKGHDIAAGIIYQDANIKVTAVENTHFRFEPGTPPYGKYKSFSYRFDTLDRSFLFTGDTGWSDA